MQGRGSATHRFFLHVSEFGEFWSCLLCRAGELSWEVGYLLLWAIYKFIFEALTGFLAPPRKRQANAQTFDAKNQRRGTTLGLAKISVGEVPPQPRHCSESRLGYRRHVDTPRYDTRMDACKVRARAGWGGSRFDFEFRYLIPRLSPCPSLSASPPPRPAGRRPP